MKALLSIESFCFEEKVVFFLRKSLTNEKQRNPPKVAKQPAVISARKRNAKNRPGLVEPTAAPIASHSCQAVPPRILITTRQTPRNMTTRKLVQKCRPKRLAVFQKPESAALVEIVP